MTILSEWLFRLTGEGLILLVVGLLNRMLLMYVFQKHIKQQHKIWWFAGGIWAAFSVIFAPYDRTALTLTLKLIHLIVLPVLMAWFLKRIDQRQLRHRRIQPVIREVLDVWFFCIGFSLARWIFIAYLT